MLVLSRKINQQIVINENIIVEVLKVKGNTVRLGIKAPKDVHIMRGELPQKEKEFGSDFSKMPESPEQPIEDGVETQCEYANVTIVFSSETEDEATIDLLPFDQAVSNSSNRMSKSQPTSEAHSSIQFRGTVPAPLHRNRLAEIASKVSIDSNN